MNPCMPRCAAFLSLLCFAVASTAGDHVLLNATFNAETVGSPPGTGGAAVGEPIGAGTAIIGLAPFPTPNLQIRDTATCCAQATAFEFLGSEEVTSGTVQIRADVEFSGTSQPVIGLREQGSYADTFLDLYSGNDQPYLAAYTGSTFHTVLGQFTPNAIVPLEIDASADQRLVSIRLNGVSLLDQAAITFTQPTTRGIGTLLIGVENSASLSGDVMRIDNLHAIACTSSVFADCLFVDSFDH
ncbi:hypothetical protein [Dokdonella soli]|uniref:hypothetical protein n=1 Tax=Dokdonella soli TaxID=529810 RepID=UPI0031D8C02D